MKKTIEDVKKWIIENKIEGEFYDEQMEQMLWGLEAGLDVSVYADPEFSELEMVEIREGLEVGVSVYSYADPKFDWMQMREIRRGLEKGKVDARLYADPKYDWGQMREIRRGMVKGVDVSIYADPKYNDDQMREIRRGLEEKEKKMKKKNLINKIVSKYSNISLLFFFLGLICFFIVSVSFSGIVEGFYLIFNFINLIISG